MGITLSTSKYSLEYSCLPKNYKGCCIPLYNYEFLITDEPSWFIYKQTDTLTPKWLYYHGYIKNVTCGDLFSWNISDLKLENQSLQFNSLLELTTFLKEKSELSNIHELKFYNINNSYINQLV